eukprot:XP_001709294.1 Hypothetical protein GL50803_92775 [Giardia lamblia ATCC 50803]
MPPELASRLAGASVLLLSCKKREGAGCTLTPVIKELAPRRALEPDRAFSMVPAIEIAAVEADSSPWFVPICVSGTVPGITELCNELP